MKSIHFLLLTILTISFASRAEWNPNNSNNSTPDSLQDKINQFPTQYFNSDYPLNQGWQPMPNDNYNYLNNGKANIIGCGYDIMGIWRSIGMKVSYNFNGLRYNVVVNDAWNPWDKTWDNGIDVTAINTDIYIKGEYFKFYAVLSTGTYYFNL